MQSSVRKVDHESMPLLNMYEYSVLDLLSVNDLRTSTAYVICYLLMTHVRVQSGSSSAKCMF